jgi:hypothetical protein
MQFDSEGHALISPLELRALAFDNPDALINHWLLPGTPMAFATYDQYIRFVDYLTDGNGNRKGNHFGRQKGAGSAIEKGTTLLTHN